MQNYEKNIHFVTDETGTPLAVQLPIEYWELLKDALVIEEIEELDEALRRLNDNEEMYVDHEAVKRECGV